MDTEAAVDDEEPDAAPAERRSRRPLLAGIAIAVLLAGMVGYGGWRAADSQPDFFHESPAEAVSPGGTVVVPATDGQECGPLFTSLHRRGRFGLWSQTHSGNVFDGFHRDARAWWSPPGGAYLTPIPCSISGRTTFTLPDDVGPGTIAACESDGRCVRIRVDG